LLLSVDTLSIIIVSDMDKKELDEYLAKKREKDKEYQAKRRKDRNEEKKKQDNEKMRLFFILLWYSLICVFLLISSSSVRCFLLFAWYSLSFSRLFAGMRKRKRKIMKK
jgi:hypothetical protein